MNSTAESESTPKITEIDLLRSGAMNRLLDLASLYDKTVVGIDMEGVLFPKGLPRRRIPPTVEATGKKGRPIFAGPGIEFLRAVSPKKIEEEQKELNVLVCTASLVDYSTNVHADILGGMQDRKERIRRVAGHNFRELPECIEPGEEEHALFVFVSDDYDWNHPPEELIRHLRRRRGPNLDVLLVSTPTLDQEETSGEEFWRSVNQGLEREPMKIGNILLKKDR